MIHLFKEKEAILESFSTKDRVVLDSVMEYSIQLNLYLTPESIKNRLNMFDDCVKYFLDSIDKNDINSEQLNHLLNKYPTDVTDIYLFILALVSTDTCYKNFVPLQLNTVKDIDHIRILIYIYISKNESGFGKSKYVTKRRGF